MRLVEFTVKDAQEFKHIIVMVVELMRAKYWTFQYVKLFNVSLRKVTNSATNVVIFHARSYKLS